MSFEKLAIKKMPPRLVRAADEGLPPPWRKGVNIHTPSLPRIWKLSEDQIAEYLVNPVLAAEYIFKVKLDEFQKVRLKISWWCKRVMDSSGFSSAKTLNFWMVPNLRCILMRDHVAAVYYPTFPQGQKVFWQYYDKFARQSSVFRHHIGKRRVYGLDGKSEEEGKAQLKNPSYYSLTFRNQSEVLLLAGSFTTGSKSQSGLRFNFLGIDEWTKIESMTGTQDGISDQLIGRCTRPCFNQFHPLWCNHQLFSATAEDTMHPGYDRYKSYLDEVRKGNPDYALINFSFKDWSRNRISVNGHSFSDEYGERSVNLDMKKNKSAAGFRQEGLGIWSKNGKGWYTGDLIDQAFQRGEERKLDSMNAESEDPVKNKAEKNVHYFLGADPAKSDTAKADDGALVALRAQSRTEFMTNNIRDWRLDFVWAYKVRKADAPQWAAIMHRKAMHFNFSGICMDHNGGGQWIRPELAKPKQIIRDQQMDVTPIACIEDEAESMSNSRFILSMFRMGDMKILELWGDLHLRNHDNLVDSAHTNFLEAFQCGLIGFPMRLALLKKEVTETWSEERKRSHKILTQTLPKQLKAISIQTNDDGTTFYTKNNARQFSAKGKKDFAYAAMYAFVRFLAWLKSSESENMAIRPEDEDGCS